MIRNPGIASAALVIVLTVGCGSKDPPARTVKAVRTAAVELSSGPETTSYSAIVAPNAQVDVAFRVSGYVVNLYETRAADGRVRPLEPGAPVTPGMTLARIRPAEYEAVVDKARGARDEAEAGVQAAEAQAAEARAALEQAEADFARIAVLWEQESVTKPAYDGSKAKLEVARAKVDAASAAVTAARQRTVSATGLFQEAEIALGDTALRSPIGGILLERRVEVGTFAGAGAPAFVVADMHVVRARFNVPDTALRAFRTGQSLSLTVDAFPDERFAGVILSIAPAADPRARSFEVILSIPNPAMRLRSGMVASIQGSAEAAGTRQMQIPVGAVVHDPVRDRYLVYTIERTDGKEVVKEALIAPGPLAGNQVVVLGGLAAGQRVIVSGANLVRPGDVVREVQ